VSFISWANAAPAWFRDLLVALLLLLSIPVGWASIALSPPGSEIAVWWPAASLTVVAAALARGNQRVLVAFGVVAVGFVANIAAGRPVLVALGYGVANAVEASVVSLIATQGGRQVSIDRVRDASRLFLGVFVGALISGALVAAVVSFDGGDALRALVSTVTSHASAVLLLATLAILPSASFRTNRPRELVLQLALLGAVTAFILSPQQQLPLGFLIFPVLVWGTFRFGVGIMALESLATAAIVGGSLFWKGGAFSAVYVENPTIGIYLVQLYVVTMAVFALVLGRARAERLRVAALSRAREVVLRSGIVGSAVGFVILERRAGSQLRLAAANDVAGNLLGTGGLDWRTGEIVHLDQFPAALVEPLGELIEGNTTAWSGLIPADSSGRIVDAHLTRVRSVRGTVVLTVQVEDVTLREEARLANERALENERATVEKLRETNRQKDDFVAAVSHELRTPLTSIIGFADELTQLDLPDEAHTYLEVVTRNAVRLGELVEDLLEVGRLNSQTQLKAVEKLDLDTVIHSVIADLHHAASDRDLAITTSGATGVSLPSVRADVSRILINLITNAIKFSPVGGEITVAVTTSAMHVRVSVHDNGAGISPADLDRVFERFYRASSAANIPGSGLGLVISRALAEGLGGTVRLRSVEGSGTTAELTLPRTPGT